MVPLPPYARRIEYLEGTGTQWIDTGVRGAGSGWLATKFMAMPVSGTGVYWRYFGASNGNDATTRTIGVYHHPRAIVGFDNGTKATTLGRTGTVFTLDKQPYRVPEGTIVGDLNFRIFTYNGPANIGSARFWYFKLWNSSNQLVRSFVPCRILDVGYLWDEVEGKFYGNSGTGDFVLGPDVREGVVPTRLNPFGVGRRQEEIRRVEYIEANTDGGTAQYIDTLVPVTTDTIIEAEWTQTDTAIQQRLFGVNDGGEKRFALYINNDGKWAVNTGTSSGGAMATVTRRDYVGSFNLGTGVCTINGSSRSNGGTPFSGTNTIPIFARRNVGTPYYADYPATMRLKSFRIIQGGNAVFDGVPVAIGSVGYLLDRVSGQLFGNQGTGSFVLGPDFVPRLRVWGDGQTSALFDISTPYPLAAGNAVTGTVNGDVRSGILDSNLSTVLDGGGNYVGEFIDLTPGTGVVLRWFDGTTGTPCPGYCEIV